jgi:antitoxin component of MazEF toxin-antitoxin module
MARRKLGTEHIRNIQKSHGTYLVSIPIEVMRQLGWHERQRVVVELSGKTKLTISDYKN